MSSLEGISSWGEGFGVPHAAAAVVTRDGVVEVFGDLDRPFGLASVTKLLTAHAALVALEEQALTLEMEAGPPGATVRHLLAHAAGYGFDSDAAVIARPGTRRIYSNRGIEVLAAFTGTETGIDFGSYLHEAVIEPLGLTATHLRGSPAHAGWSTVADLAAFAGELLQPRLIARPTLDDATRVHFPGLVGVLPGLGRFDPLDWGLGFEKNFGRPGHWAGSVISSTAFGHFGGAGTFLWVDPAAGVACVCLTDQDFGDWAKQAWPVLTDAVLAAHGRSDDSLSRGGQ
jgi:CubicO group peptidase (beta-lactamase class C family)